MWKRWVVKENVTFIITIGLIQWILLLGYTTWVKHGISVKEADYIRDEDEKKRQCGDSGE
jgi:hypothetical protein